MEVLVLASDLDNKGWIMESITLTAPQAQELHTTGRLTGYREKCEWQPPRPPEKVEPYWHDSSKWVVTIPPKANGSLVYERPDGSRYSKPFTVEMSSQEVVTPPRDTDTTYAVKEPYRFSTRIPGHIMLERDNPGIAYDFLPADTMPDGDEYLHARITDIKLIISDGELWWDMDLEKVG